MKSIAKELLDRKLVAIKRKHSYECFEFAVYNITSINEEYLNWIDADMGKILMYIISVVK